jgi:hypothetical protein
MNWMYWLAIGVAVLTVIGGWVHSRYDGQGEDAEPAGAHH